MKEKMMRLLSKKLIIGLVAGVAVLGVTVAIVVAMVSASPWKRVKDSVEKTVNVLKEQPFLMEGRDVLDNGSVEVSMNTEALTYGLVNVDISAKWYSAIKDKTFALVAGAAMNGTPFLDAFAKLDEQMLVVSSEALLDEIYGMEMKQAPDLKQDLEVFWKASGKQIEKYLIDSVSVEEAEGTMSFRAEDVAFDMIAFRANEEGITEFLYNTATYLKESQEFAQLVDAYITYFETLYAQGGITTEPAFDRDEVVKAVYDTLDAVINKKEEIKKELSGTTFCIKFVISEEGYLFDVEIEVERDGEPVLCSVTVGPAPNRISEVTVRAEVENKVYYVLYTAVEDTEETFRGSVQFVVGGEVVTELQFEKDRVNGSFTVQLLEDGEKDSRFRVTGTITPEEGGSVIDVEELLLDSVEYDLGIGIMIKKEDSIPEMPECTEVLPMEEESMQRIIEDLTEELQALFSMFL